ncbi:ABC transporter ATP-binding protein [Jiangella sp. DSM 45060]|uniref:ABC transporter ATP-binding protein n=1 Tax=Jiangella sp. DSM 45060 TaxID=1798224 RepID=UPI00087BDBC7|nr:ABC transporter ATP-binding protein [Jiangella sp. DSM 45060]SDT15359.1 oligopeptide transport system ATP-binding protein [Jiangella sp. DSM 45060]
MTGPDEHLLSVRGLRLRVGDEAHDVVRGATLHAARGEVVGIAGESGSGKSLTLRAIAGLLPTGVTVAGGDIEVDRVDVVRAGPQALRGLRGRTVGMVFQEPMTALNPTMRIGRQIAEAARAHGDLSRSQARARAVELLERVGFPEPARRYRLFPHQLSGGMRQRVVIAIALAGNPSLLLCDEPTTALDATVTLRILDLLTDLVRDLGIGIVFVTHDLGVAARICDRIAVMYAGQVVEEGPTEQLLRRPRHPYTLALLRAVPTRDRDIDGLRAIPGNPPQRGEELPGCAFAPRCEYAEPECRSGIEFVPVGAGRSTACRRHPLLAAMAGGLHD